VPERRALRILFTNHQLGDTGGTEANVRDLALGMQRRGHRPLAYAPALGKIADVLRAYAVPVVDDLALINESPDIIHATHAPAVLEAIVRFPHVPVLQTCQGVGYTMSKPIILPQVMSYVAVDQVTHDYLIENGAPTGRLQIVYNAVDLQRIPVRSQPLPPHPCRALIFTKTESQVPLVEEACRRAGIAVDRLGRGVNRVVAEPERELVRYDLVFATARSAMEAIASGAATIVMDGRGLAGMATRANFQHLRQHNFGLRSLVHDITLEAVMREIEQYDPAEAMALSQQFKKECNLENQLDVFEKIYAAALREFPACDISEAELLAALVPILHQWLPRFPGTDWPWQYEKAALLEQIKYLDDALAWNHDILFRPVRFFIRRIRRRLFSN
jgi:hypothetical protein